MRDFEITCLNLFFWADSFRMLFFECLAIRFTELLCLVLYYLFTRQFVGRRSKLWLVNAGVVAADQSIGELQAPCFSKDVFSPWRHGTITSCYLA